MPTGYETRVATTEQLLLLVQAAVDRGFNRAPDMSFVTALEPDPDGWHVLSIVVPFHTRHWPPQNATPDPPHHRVDVLMKCKDKPHPASFMLDVTDDQFRMLGTVNDARAEMARRNAAG